MRWIRILINPETQAREGLLFCHRKEGGMGNKYKLTDQGGVAFFQKGGGFLFDELDLPLIRDHTWHHG